MWLTLALLVSCNITPQTSVYHRNLFISASTSARSLTRKPTLPELLNLKTSSGNTVDVVQQIGTHYSKLGPLLLNDGTGAVTSAIVSQYQLNAVAINQEILTRWLQGQGKKPVSWSTLTDVLKEVGLSELSQMIQDSLTRSTTPTSCEMDITHSAALIQNTFYLYLQGVRDLWR